MKINKTENILGSYFKRINTFDKNRHLGKKDKLMISNMAKDFNVAMDKLKQLPDIRKEKVERIKKQVESGTYNVDGRLIAEKMLENIDFDKTI